VPNLEPLLTGLTLGVLGIAVLSDLRGRRIPNRLTLPAALVGLLLHTALEGGPGAQQAAVGWIVGFAWLLLPCLGGWVGGGDVKLLAAVGALQGPALVSRAGLYGVLIGGLISLAALAAARRGHRPAETKPRPRLAIPYGPALAAGTVLALVIR
jgi:prepilin peptidase CpaA